jgi:hypothetical protein
VNKQDLLNALTAKFHAVGDPRHQFAEGGLKVYAVMVFELAGDDISRRNIEFVVENEGLGNEAAYWAPEEPETMPAQNQFISDINVYVAARIADGTIEAAFVTEEDLINEKAIAWAYAQVASEWREVKVLLRRDVNGDIEHIVLSIVQRTGN